MSGISQISQRKVTVTSPQISGFFSCKLDRDVSSSRSLYCVNPPSAGCLYQQKKPSSLSSIRDQSLKGSRVVPRGEAVVWLSQEWAHRWVPRQHSGPDWKGIHDSELLQTSQIIKVRLNQRTHVDADHRVTEINQEPSRVLSLFINC